MFSRQPDIWACHDTRQIEESMCTLNALDLHRIQLMVDREARWWFPVARYRSVDVRISTGVVSVMVAYSGVRDPALKCKHLVYVSLSKPQPLLKRSKFTRFWQQIQHHAIAGAVIALLAGCSSPVIKLVVDLIHAGVGP